MSDQQIKIKKVQPYPIAATLTGRPTPLPCRILKLTLNAALIDTGGSQLQVQEKVNLEFALPVIKTPIKVDCVVVKFYDKFVSRVGSDKKIERWDELHFTTISKEMRMEIQKFLLAIRQV